MKIKDLLIPKKYTPDLMVDNKAIELKATKPRIDLLLNLVRKVVLTRVLCGYLHIKPRDYTRVTQKSCGNLCNLVVPNRALEHVRKVWNKKKNLCYGQIDPTQAVKATGFNHREHRVVKPILCVPLCSLWLYPIPMSFMSIALLCIRLTTTKKKNLVKICVIWWL